MTRRLARRRFKPYPEIVEDDAHDSPYEIIDTQGKDWLPTNGMVDKVRRRLERILAEARAAEAMPWDWSQQSLYKTIFPQMARLLPEDEAAQYCFQFEQEWERLKAA